MIQSQLRIRIYFFHRITRNRKINRPLTRNKRVFGLVIDFGTSQSPKSTRPLTTYLCPSRPGHQALRNNFASSLLLRTWLPMTGRRVRRPTLFSLWRKARRENSAASRLLGSTSLRFALHGWQRTPRPIAASPVTCRPWQIRDTIRWSPFKWPFRDSSMLIGVSSYVETVSAPRCTGVMEIGRIAVDQFAPPVVILRQEPMSTVVDLLYRIVTFAASHGERSEGW